MARVVKVIELMSESPKGWEDAAQNAVKEASRTLRNIRSIYIKDFTAAVDGGKINSYRISAKVTFEMER
jgi:flavin-binding protein dodecin